VRDRSPSNHPSSGPSPVRTEIFGSSRTLVRRIDLWREAMKTIAAGLMLLLLLFMIPEDSFAGGGHCAKDFWGNCKGGHRSWRHSYQYRHCAKDFWGRCADGRPRWRRHHHHGGGWVGSREEINRGAVCQPRRRVVGIERTTYRNAKKEAEDAWMSAVRYDHGERFQNLENAKDVRYNCDPSTPVSPAAFVKKTYVRCAVEGTPCRAQTGAAEEKFERRFTNEDDKDDQ
jgi:hypothetical protein